MWDLPFQQTPCNFPEEEKLMKRVYRVLASIEAVARARWKKQPRLARDLKGFYWLLLRAVAGIESQLHHPGRLRTWMDEDAKAKRPPPSSRLLIGLLGAARKAAGDVRAVHDRMAEEDEDAARECCRCLLCEDVIDLKWLLGKAKRLLAATTWEAVS